MFRSRIASAYCSLALWTAGTTTFSSLLTTPGSTTTAAVLVSAFSTLSSVHRGRRAAPFRPLQRPISSSSPLLLINNHSKQNPQRSILIQQQQQLQMSTTTTTPDSAASVEEADNVAHNFRHVQERVQQACETTKSAPVRLVAVSKTKPISLLQAAYQAGCRTFGENYVQELVDKVPVLPDDIQWHFIGALQSNKVNLLVKAVQPIDRLTVETVGSIKLANKLQTAVQNLSTTAAGADGAAAPPRRLRVMVQVNTSAEDTKSGVEPGDECVALCRHIIEQCPALELRGLMTIGAPGDVTCFTTLRECRDAVLQALSLSTSISSLELSMGMSDDFEQAIAAGSTNVRVGSTIFGARYYPNKKAAEEK